uniref:Uncharacterized protein n=1 Tax=Rhizophora mucronata TaxID=61149 RepID=A0A2P2NAT7_RHIMU
MLPHHLPSKITTKKLISLSIIMITIIR